MNEIAIKVEGLGKRYRIGAQQQAYKTLRDKLNDTALAPFRAARHLLTRNGNGAEQGAKGKEQSAKNGSSQSSGPSPLALSSLPNTFWALKDVSFEIKAGEVVGIIGRNGAGKSTLLKILSRITEPTEGYADIHGRIASLLEVGTGFHPELTGRENIYLNGSILGMKRAEINRKFDEIVAFAETEKFIDTPVKHYSSGMYVRLAFAVAAHLDPEILLVDEVLAVGDGAFQKKCLGKIGEVAREGRTVLLVSHNMAAILGLCSSALVLRDGRLDFTGNPHEAAKWYQNSTRSVSLLQSDTKTKVASRKAFEVLGVRFLDGQGQLADEFRTGEAMQVELRVRTPANGDRFAVGVAIFSQDGVYCYGANTFLDKYELTADRSEVIVTQWITALNLLDGMYSVTAVLTNENGTVQYEYLPREFHFKVISDGHDHGILFLPHHWQVRA